MKIGKNVERGVERHLDYEVKKMHNQHKKFRNSRKNKHDVFIFDHTFKNEDWYYENQ